MMKYDMDYGDYNILVVSGFLFLFSLSLSLPLSPSLLSSLLSSTLSSLSFSLSFLSQSRPLAQSAMSLPLSGSTAICPTAIPRRLRPLSLVHNASGCWVKTKEFMDEIAAMGSSITTIVSKTCTLHAFDGHPTPNFYELGQLSLNCKGMPNFGYAYYRDLWADYTTQGLTYVLSVDGADVGELRTMVVDYDAFLERAKGQAVSANEAVGEQAPIASGEERLISRTSCDLEWVELNVSCPNKASQQEQPRLLAYDPEALDCLLAMLRSLRLQHIRFLIKLAPCTDRWLLAQVAQVLLHYHPDVVGGVVCSNSIPNAHSANILSRPTAGISGLPTKLLSQSNLVQLRAEFARIAAAARRTGRSAADQHEDPISPPMLLVGCGGVETSQDVLEYLHLGAHAVQVGRALHLEGRVKLLELHRQVTMAVEGRKESAAGQVKNAKL